MEISTLKHLLPYRREELLQEGCGREPVARVERVSLCDSVLMHMGPTLFGDAFPIAQPKHGDVPICHPGRRKTLLYSVTKQLQLEQES